MSPGFRTKPHGPERHTCDISARYIPRLVRCFSCGMVDAVPSCMSTRGLFLTWVLGAATVGAASSAAAQTARAGSWSWALGFGGGASFRGNEGDSNPLAVGLGLRAGRTFAGAARFHLGLAVQYHPRIAGDASRWTEPDAVGLALDLGGDVPLWRLVVRPYVGLGALHGTVRHAPAPAPPPGTPFQPVDLQSSAPLALTLQPGVSVFWRHGLLRVGAELRGVVTVVGDPSVGALLFTGLLGLTLD